MMMMMMIMDISVYIDIKPSTSISVLCCRGRLASARVRPASSPTSTLPSMAAIFRSEDEAGGEGVERECAVALSSPLSLRVTRASRTAQLRRC